MHTYTQSINGNTVVYGILYSTLIRYIRIITVLASPWSGKWPASEILPAQSLFGFLFCRLPRTNYSLSHVKVKVLQYRLLSSICRSWISCKVMTTVQQISWLISFAPLQQLSLYYSHRRQCSVESTQRFIQCSFVVILGVLHLMYCYVRTVCRLAVQTGQITWKLWATQ